MCDNEYMYKYMYMCPFATFLSYADTFQAHLPFIFELHREKTGLLPMRKQRRRSASQ